MHLGIISDPNKMYTKDDFVAHFTGLLLRLGAKRRVLQAWTRLQQIFNLSLHNMK